MGPLFTHMMRTPHNRSAQDKKEKKKKKGSGNSKKQKVATEADETKGKKSRAPSPAPEEAANPLEDPAANQTAPPTHPGPEPIIKPVECNSKDVQTFQPLPHEKKTTGKTVKKATKGAGKPVASEDKTVKEASKKTSSTGKAGIERFCEAFNEALARNLSGSSASLPLSLPATRGPGSLEGIGPFYSDSL